MRLHRGGSPKGRQRYRFVHEDGARVWSINFTGLDGQTLHLEAVDGVVETDDAETAKALDSISTVRNTDQ